MRSFAIRLALRRMRRKVGKEDKAKINIILGDQDLFGLFAEALNEESGVAGIGGDAPVLDFFKWLITFVTEHPDAIIAIISKILLLFAGETHA